MADLLRKMGEGATLSLSICDIGVFGVSGWSERRVLTESTESSLLIERRCINKSIRLYFISNKYASYFCILFYQLV